MGTLSEPERVVPLLAITAPQRHAHQWSLERAERQWGRVAEVSPLFDFTETDYYAPTMGHELKKSLLVFSDLADPALLADWKLASNLWEQEYAGQFPSDVPRPVNLDPGYLSLSKLVLASTKNHAHRVYLRHGIYAELTLQFRGGAWHPLSWTYPDYRRADFQEVLSRGREVVRRAK